MKVVIQRVKLSKVEVNNKIIGQIDHGILVLIGVAVMMKKLMLNGSQTKF